MATISVVEFVKPMPPYHVGEKAGFPPEIGHFYVEKGFARMVEKAAPQVHPDTNRDRARALAEERAGFGGEMAAAERVPPARNRAV